MLSKCVYDLCVRKGGKIFSFVASLDDSTYFLLSFRLQRHGSPLFWVDKVLQLPSLCQEKLQENLLVVLKNRFV